MSITIQAAVNQLLQVVDELRRTFPKKRFTLDGRLVGDLGETLVEAVYDLELFDTLVKHHDAVTPDGRLVQIKATMQKALTFPADHVPEYYLGVQIHKDGSISEVFNGPGSTVRQALEHRKLPKTNLHSISINMLMRLNGAVQDHNRIPRRTNRLS